jgi:hypothetical protein
MYVNQHCHPSNSIVSEAAGIEPRTFVTMTLTSRRSNHSARSYPSRKLDKVKKLPNTVVDEEKDLLVTLRVCAYVRKVEFYQYERIKLA